MPPSMLHEVLVTMFRDRPALAAELLVDAPQVDLPAFEQAQLSSAELTAVAPTEYRADAVVTLTAPDGVVSAVVVEVQLSRDKRKRRSWPVYVATLHARLGCPVALLVVCPDQAVADWCAVPIPVGNPGYVLTAVVAGPAQVPAVTDPDTARRSPELTVLAALAHPPQAGQDSSFIALLAALDAVDEQSRNLYADVVYAAMPAASLDYLEEKMTAAVPGYQSQLATNLMRRSRALGHTEGRSEGLAEAVLALLDVRGVEVSGEVSQRIARCTDVEQLTVWIRRAATADKVDELFD